MDQIWSTWLASSITNLWFFMDGLVDGSCCKATTLLFGGSETTPWAFTINFTSPHSSTQAMLMPLFLGCCCASAFGPYSSVTFVSAFWVALCSLSNLLNPQPQFVSLSYSPFDFDTNGHTVVDPYPFLPLGEQAHR